MKILRSITILVVLVLVFSAWTPAPVLAKAETASATITTSSVSTSVDDVTVKKVKLTINNKTGGTLYVTLTGSKYYSFVVTNQGKSRYDIDSGRYTYTVRASACAGTISKTANFKNGGSLGPYVCNR